MNEAASPISAIDRTRPKIITYGMLPGRARNRQHVVERHGHVGDDDLPARPARRSCGRPRDGADSGLAGLRGPPSPTSSAVEVRSSRHIFQQTQSSRMPPASRRPTICRSWMVMPAKTMRSTVAAIDANQDGLVALFLGEAGSGEADHDGVVASQHEIDHDDLEKRGDFRGEEIAHAMPLRCVRGRHSRIVGPNTPHRCSTGFPAGNFKERNERGRSICSGRPVAIQSDIAAPKSRQRGPAWSH